MHKALSALLESGSWGAWLGKPGGTFLLRADGMPEADRVLLAVVARAVLSGDRGELKNQLDRPYPEPDWPEEQEIASPRQGPPEPVADVEAPPTVMSNGQGGFNFRCFIGRKSIRQGWTGVSGSAVCRAGQLSSTANISVS